MSDKDFKVKNKLVLNGLTQTGPLVADANKQVDATPYLTTLQGGTGTTTSPAAGQVLYSASGTTYAPATLNTLDVKGATYSADAPTSPFVGQVWIESDSSSDSFDPNIIRRKSFTATAGQTTFTADLEFIQGYEQVFFNGMLLVRNNDYTTPTNTSVVLTTAAAVNDIVEIVSITNLNSINAATTTTNTFTGDQTIQGSLNLTGNSTNKINAASKFTVDTSNSWGSISLARQSGQIGVLKIQGADSTGTANVLRLSNDSGNGSAIDVYHDSLRFYVESATTERMRINAVGNVGIGTSSPTAKLDVNGSINATNYNMAGKNFLINGGFDIWQRGNTFSNPGNLAYTADRWFSIWGSSNRTVSRQAGFSGNNYCIRVGRNSGISDTLYTGIATIIESANMYLLQGKTVTLSFYARAGSNFSGNVLATVVQSATGIDQGSGNWWAGNWTAITTNAAYYINPTTTATRYSTTFTVPSDATELIIYHQYQGSGTAGAADYFETTGFQLEIGSTATPFSRAGGDMQGELAKCQRYYFRNTAGSIYGALDGSGVCITSTTAAISLSHPVTMRTFAASLDYGNIGLTLNNGNAASVTSAAIQYAGNKASWISVSIASGLTVGNGTILIGANNANGYIGLSAEL